MAELTSLGLLALTQHERHTIAKCEMHICNGQLACFPIGTDENPRHS